MICLMMLEEKGRFSVFMEVYSRFQLQCKIGEIKCLHSQSCFINMCLAMVVLSPAIYRFSYFWYLSIEIDQNRLTSIKVDNHKKSYDRFLSTSDICRLIGIEFDRQRSIFIDYRNYRSATSCLDSRTRTTTSTRFYLLFVSNMVCSGIFIVDNRALSCYRVADLFWPLRH